MSARKLAEQPQATLPEHAPVDGVPAAVPVEAAANDDQPIDRFSVAGDPLWGMAIASVILFAVLAALMAMS